MKRGAFGFGPHRLRRTGRLTPHESFVRRSLCRVGIAIAIAGVSGCSLDSVTSYERPSTFRFELRFADPVAPDQNVLNAILVATERWHQVVKSGGARASLTLPGGACEKGQDETAVGKGVLLLFVHVVPIDGPGRVLARSAPCALDGAAGLPVAARIEVDADDAPLASKTGTLVTILQHELGHALGFGSLWTMRGLLAGSASTHLTFTGSSARGAFLASGGALYGGTPVPVEVHGETGTIGNHWPATVFGAELMTAGLGSSDRPPLSIVTVASLEDLGYGVDYSAADSFSIGAPVSRSHVANPLWDLSYDGFAGTTLVTISTVGAVRRSLTVLHP